MGKPTVSVAVLLAFVTIPAFGCGGGKNDKKTKHYTGSGIKKEGTGTTDGTVADPKITVTITSSPSAPLDQGATFLFTATVVGPTMGTVNWSASKGIIDATGKFTAPSSGGSVTITATSTADSTAKASVTVTVNDVSVTATGPTTMFSTGGGLYTATVAGTVLNKSVTWSLTGTGDVGSIDTLGNYTPTTSRGSYTVTVVATSAADTTKKASVNLSVTASSLTITPANPTVFVNESAQLSASGVGVSNNVAWSTDGGSITAEGLYTAPATVGTYTVTAQSNDSAAISGSATITVALRPIITIGGSAVNTLSGAADLLTGGTANFSASVTNGTGAVTWSATCGTIDQSGNYTAPSTPGTCYITATSVEFPWVSVTIVVHVCGAFDEMLTYANPGTTPADTSDDVITSRVRLSPAAAGSMFTTYDTFDAAWLTVTADPLASARTYSAPGDDGKWGTADDAVAAFYSVLTDGNGLQTGYAQAGTAGTDGIYGTPDDEIVEYVTYARNVTGQVIQATHAVTAGTDGIWGTADDGIGSIDVFFYDAGNLLVEVDHLNPNGNLHSYVTYQNDGNGRPALVTNYVNPGVSGWKLGSDSYNRQWVYTYDAQGRPSLIVEKVFVGASNTPKPQNDSEVLYTYAGADRLPVAMDRYATGADKLIGTGDDVLSKYEKSSNVCPF